MSKSKRIKTGYSLAVFLTLVLVGAAASAKAEIVDVTITANKPDYVVTYPSGFACDSFDLQIEGWFGKQHIKEFKDKNGLLVRALSAGTGAALRYTNLTTGQTFSSKSNGAVSHTTYNPDGSLTLKLTGHNVVFLLPTDIPPGPSTTLYVGRVVISIDTSGNYTVQEENGNKTDICAAVSYCTGRKDLAIVAHADDDFYFAADQIKPNIAAGHCFKVVHLTGGYADRNDYQKRVDAALAGYERMLGLQSPLWTETWDEVNGKKVHRYWTALTKDVTGATLQTLEVQVVGLPCGYHDHGDSGMGVTLAALYNNANASTTTIDGMNMSYTLAEVRAFLDQIFTEEQPSTIFTLDPYGSFFYNGHEGQHPDHIVTARLVQESAYVASHPNAVKYFKTYNLNNLPVNLGSDGIIAKNEAMLGYVSVDPGTWTLGEGATDCSGLSISDQLGDYGWLCKDYAAQDGTYFQAAQLKLVDGRCLAVRKSDGKVTFATCTDTAYATDFSLDGQGQVFVGNATRRRLRTDLSAGSTVTAPKWDDTPTDGHVSEWRYNPTSKTLQQTNPSNAQLICVAPGTPGGTDVFMFDCGSGAALTVTRGAAAPTGVPLTIKNKASGQCVLLSATGVVSMGDCNSSDARLELNAAGQLASAANPNQCLQREKFQQRSSYVGAPCNSASFGQRFTLTRVASGTDYTFVSHSPASCMEDLDGLSGWECHNYEQQLWVVTDASAGKSAKTDSSEYSRQKWHRNRDK